MGLSVLFRARIALFHEWRLCAHHNVCTHSHRRLLFRRLWIGLSVLARNRIRSAAALYWIPIGPGTATQCSQIRRGLCAVTCQCLSVFIIWSSDSSVVFDCVCSEILAHLTLYGKITIE